MLRERGRLEWQRHDWKAVTFGVLPRGCWGEQECDSGRWCGWRVAVHNPLRLGVSYSVRRLGGRSKGGGEGELGSNAAGKFLYELIFTSCALVEGLAL